MRLINVENGELHEFVGKVPTYATLSHRWSQDETSYENYIASNNDAGSMGLRKIEAFRAFLKLYNSSQPQEKKVEWAWADTCCIDKRSSAELSEAINSMAQWYEQCVFCVAYLEDVPSSSSALWGEMPLEHWLKNSKWFTRGWTLQELLFPSVVMFCDCKWNIIELDRGSTLVAEITKIPIHCLRYLSFVRESSIAERMSWAAHRNTTRVEDQSYCLLGLFNVNMPLLYGEGHKAFFRLQRQLVEQFDDESVFAWEVQAPSYAWTERGLFARSPRWFKNANFGPILRPSWQPRPTIQNNNRVKIRSKALKIDYIFGMEYFIIELNSADSAGTRCLVVLSWYGGDDYIRLSKAVAGNEVWSEWVQSLSSELKISLVEERDYQIYLNEEIQQPVLRTTQNPKTSLQERFRKLQPQAEAMEFRGEHYDKLREHSSRYIARDTSASKKSL